MTHRKRSKRSHNPQLTFRQLEPRNLLASITNTLPVGVDLITNGGFERATDGNTSHFYQDANVDGWNGVDSATGQRLNIFAFGDASNAHKNILELDSTAAQVDSVYQDVLTNQGDSYILSFEMRERSVNAAAHETTNQLELFWDGQSMGTFSATNHWQTVTVVVEGATDGTSRLEFREVSADASDGRGPLLDNVSLVKIASPVNLINGSFDDNVVADTSVNQAADVIDGWSAMGTNSADRLIAIKNDNANDGSQYLQLDTGEGRLDRIYRDISTTSGEKYYLTFDMRGSEGDQLRVRWGGEWVGTFEAESEWQTFGLLVDAADAEDTTRLIFRELNATDPAGTGPQIDNVRLSQVGEFEAFSGLRALSEVDPAQRDGIYSQAPSMTIDTTKTYRAKITIESGAEIDLLLYADRAPQTVNNFVNLAEDGWYDGLSFNRVVNDGAGDPFVAQAGGPFEDNTSGGPGYTFADEIVSGLDFSSRNGLLAMANAGPGTNGSQFFLTYGQPTFLNGQHTIYGEIELSDTSSFTAFNNLTFREPGSSTPGDVITSIQITVEDPV